MIAEGPKSASTVRALDGVPDLGRDGIHRTPVQALYNGDSVVRELLRLGISGLGLEQVMQEQ